MIFPNFFQIDFENIKVPFLLLIEVKLIRNLFGKCELESCSIKSRSEGLRGGIQKKNCFFSEFIRKGGGVSPNPKFPNQKMIEIFLDFFAERGGVSPNPKFL